MERRIGVLLALLLLINTAAERASCQINPLLTKAVRAQEEGAGGRITYAELGTDITADKRIVNPGSAFSPETPRLVCVWRVEAIPQGGTILRGVWVAEETGGVAPPNYQIAEVSYPLPGPAPMVGEVSLSKPTKGWPSGRYRVELYLGEKVARTVPFRIWTEAEDKAYKQITPLLEEEEKLEQKGDYGAAVALMQQALAVAEKSFGSEHPDTAALVNNLAGLYKETGDYARSEQLYRRAVALAEKLDGTERPVFAATLNNLAQLYTQKGDYTQAEQLLQRSLTVSEKTLGAESLLTATILNNLALISQAKGDYKQAQRLYERALPVYEKATGTEHAADFATLLNNLAELSREQRDYQRAEPLYRRALAVAERALPADHPSLAVTLNNLGLLYLAKGDSAQAEPLLRRALAIYEKTLGAQHANTGALLNNLALLSQERGEYAQAEPLYGRALNVLEASLGRQHPNVAQVLVSLSGITARSGDIARTTSLLTRANDIREQNLSLILATGSEQQKQLYLDTLFGETNLTLSFHLQAAPTDPTTARLALTTLLRRKGRALDAMADQIGALRRRLNASDQTLLDELSAARSKLATLMLGKSSEGTSANERQATINSLEVEAQRLEREVSTRSAEYRTQMQPVTLERVQSAVPTDAALIEFVRYYPYDFRAKKNNVFGAARYAAYVLRHEGSPSWVELGEAETVDRNINDLRTALSKPSSTNARQTARALDQQIMQPVRRLLGDTRRLFLSPDGALNLIPFGALVDEHNHYLIEDYTLTYLTSGRDLLRFETHLPSEQATTIIANPIFDNLRDDSPATTGQGTAAATAARRSTDFRGVRFSPLPGTAGEAKAISLVFANAKLLTEAQATEAAIKQVRAPRVLHVATHGFFLPDQPRPEAAETRGISLSVGSAPDTPARIENPLLRSGLVLAGANQGQGGGGEDGILTALEAAGLNLWGTQLVVLSACETGVGEVKNGEGVYGLRRALVLAGSESQVMSLWQVSDEATRDLMVEYYKRLQKGEGRTEALRQVQLEMLRGSEQSREPGRQNKGTDGLVDYSHPFYWASFIQSGDWRRLTE